MLLARLIQARKDAGVTQIEVAAKLGKPQSHVSKCETQERDTRQPALIRAFG